jgi:hypothetical protein
MQQKIFMTINDGDLDEACRCACQILTNVATDQIPY